jgi:hypothetical protein
MRQSTIETACSDLSELFTLIDRRPDDMYITAMKQYIVNPIACLQAIRITAPEETGSPPQQSASPTNTGSPKLPTLVEVCAELQRRSDHITTYGMYALGVNECYDVMCRQLRAGA